MGVAWDTTGTYTPGRPLSRSGTSHPQLDLFQAYTIGGTAHGRQRITTHPLWDSAPTLALTPGSTFPLTLIWVRGNTEGESETQTDLRRGLGNAAGTWSSSTLASLGFSNFWPDATVVGTTTYLTWIRDGRAMFADNASRRFVSHQFNTPVIPHGPSHVAVSSGVVTGAGRPRSTGRSWPPGSAVSGMALMPRRPACPGSSSWSASRPEPARRRRSTSASPLASTRPPRSNAQPIRHPQVGASCASKGAGEALLHCAGPGQTEVASSTRDQIAKTRSQVPADREHDHVGWVAEARERRVV